MNSMTSPAIAWFDASSEIKALLAKAADYWHDTIASRRYVEQAIAQGKAYPDVLIAAYRYFFYKNDSEMALWIAQIVMEQVREAEQFPDDWDDLQPFLTSRKEEPIIRLYLHAYAASGLLLAKLGDQEGALAIATHIKTIDDRREFGGDLLHNILTTPPDPED